MESKTTLFKSTDHTREPFNLKLPDLTNQTILNRNIKLLDYMQTCMNSLSGFIAGVLGLTGFAGLLFYPLCSLLFAILLNLKIIVQIRRLELSNNQRRASSEQARYFKEKWYIFLSGHSNGIFTYLFWWAFLYGLVHVY
ncbi:hypothetical protein GJ496_005763 [Pomphorhynchus laevis]|nr:hypothetical protein GJ496_005763 [Pomphorhynchus laevis]